MQISLIQYQQAVFHHLHQFCGLLLWIDVVIPVRISRKLSSVGDITLPLIILCVYLTDILVRISVASRLNCQPRLPVMYRLSYSSRESASATASMKSLL